jgi:hypothetical protein
MRVWRCVVLLLATVVSCGDEDAGIIDAITWDAESFADAGGLDTLRDAGGATDAVDPTCGAERLPTAGDPLGGSYALAIAADGTVYYSVNSSNGPIGRRLPGGPADDSWLILAPGKSAEVMALALGDGALYASRATSPSGGVFSLWRVNVVSGAQELLLNEAGTVYGLAVGPDGSLFFTDWDTSAVYRIAEAGTALPVSAGPLSGPTSLLFVSPTELLVLERYNPGAVIRLTLDATTLTETARGPVGTEVGGGGYSLGRDELGRYYVVVNAINPALYRYDENFMNRQTLGDDLSLWGALAFGKGSLYCRDLYVSDNSLGLARFDVGARGVP